MGSDLSYTSALVPSAEALVFRPGVAERLEAYVYLLIDPRNGLVFYVGKGRGDRAYAHAQAALAPQVEATESNLKLDTIRTIQASGEMVRLEILRHGMTDGEAFLVEGAAIDLLSHHGQIGPGETAATLSNLQRGHDVGRGISSVEDLAARYAARHVDIEDRLILIRPSNLWWEAKNDDERYEATRKWWRVDEARRSRYHHAAAVVDGIVRMVWKIDHWEQDPSLRRAAFTGSRDPQLEARYVWGDVSRFMPVGAQNPIRYVQPSETTVAGELADEGAADRE